MGVSTASGNLSERIAIIVVKRSCGIEAIQTPLQTSLNLPKGKEVWATSG